MTELAYMIREDWTQRGSAMEKRSEVIRSWLGDRRVVYAIGDPRRFNDKDRGPEYETAMSIANTGRPPKAVSFTQLTELADSDSSRNIAVVAIHPRVPYDCDEVRTVYEGGRLDRMYVHVWARGEIVRSWLEGRRAIDLHVGTAVEAPDPVQVAACEEMVDQEYNGLSTGNGKSTVIQLLRAFNADGYPLDSDAWLRAYFAAGGAFRHAEVVEKFVREVREGVRHRVTQRLKPEIVSILRKRVAEGRTN
ncbi:hypothetical protein [Promicromonospora sp. NPDC090134]|uniref:hypothetical protein n=1 Tax=Promicromonospora sp. NPDC090134 TaxID=3364408 RepID=UPI00382269C9